MKKMYLVALDINGMEFVLVGDGVPGLPELESVSGKMAFFVAEITPNSDVAGSEERYTRMCEGFKNVEVDILQTLMRRASQITACVLLGSTSFSEVTLTDNQAAVSQIPRKITFDQNLRELNTGRAFIAKTDDGRKVIVTGDSDGRAVIAVK